jgi:hypothetical protein
MPKTKSKAKLIVANGAGGMAQIQDPTFNQAFRLLAQITPAVIIEWLRRGGSFSMPPLKRRRG